MLCGFGTDFVGGRLPFVLHPAVLPKLQSIAQRLGLPTPTGTEPPSSLPSGQSGSPSQLTTPSPIPPSHPLMAIEPLLLSAMMSTLQQSISVEQQPQVNPAAKALFTLLMQQQAIRNNLLPSLIEANNNVSPTTSAIQENRNATEPMDFSADNQLPSLVQQQTTSNSSSDVSPTDMTTARASSKLRTNSTRTTSASFMAPSSSSSPVETETHGLSATAKTVHERTPHRRLVASSNNFLNGENGVGMIVHGEPIECLPAYAKLVNSRWSHKHAASLQRGGTNSSLNNSDDMTVGPSPNANGNACSPNSACMHVCIFCGKRYSRKYGLKIHLRTHTGYRPLECRYCHRRFGDPSNLNKHLRLHAQVESPFVCKFCGKSLVRRRDLDRHLRSRHPTMVATGAAATTSTVNTPQPSQTPISMSSTPAPRPQQQQQSRNLLIAHHQPMVFPSGGGVSPLSSTSPTTTAASHSH